MLLEQGLKKVQTSDYYKYIFDGKLKIVIIVDQM